MKKFQAPISKSQFQRVVQLFFFLGLATWHLAHGASSKIDSLLSLLKKDKEDTNKVNHLNNLSREYVNISSYDSSISFATNALKLSQQFKPAYKKGIANAYDNIGIVYDYQSDYPKALDFYFKSLKMYDELVDKIGIAACYNNIGIIYKHQGDYSKALDYYLMALKMKEEIGDKKRIASSLGNIGGVYLYQRNYPKALDYYFRALQIDEELGNKNGVARHLGNIGNVYKEQAVYINGMAAQQKQYFEQALEYCIKALKIYEEIGDKRSAAINLGNIGSIYTAVKNYSKAEKYLLEAIDLDKKIGAMNEERQFEELLSDLYTKTNLFQLALEHYKKAMVLKDTLFSEGKNKEITRKEMNYEFEKKEAAAKAEADKQQAVAEAEKQRQRIVLILVSCVLLLVLVFAGFIFRALRITQKQKQLIEQQKKMVEEKQNEILASIRYAKRIQDAILPTEKYIDKTLMRLMKK